ncbi:MAG: hypothetical protein WBD36_14240 [Bacteroidota bacterium]
MSDDGGWKRVKGKGKKEIGKGRNQILNGVFCEKASDELKSRWADCG